MFELIQVWSYIELTGCLKQSANQKVAWDFLNQWEASNLGDEISYKRCFRILKLDVYCNVLYFIYM